MSDLHCQPTRRTILRWTAVLACALVGLGGLPAAAAAPATVKLIVDYGDGVQKHIVMPWKQDMTVLDATKQAATMPHGLSKVETSGSGATAFLTLIDDVKNQGGGSAKKNWLYSVNDEPGKVGFGAKTLKNGDVALWKFAVYEDQ